METESKMPLWIAMNNGLLVGQNEDGFYFAESSKEHLIEFEDPVPSEWMIAPFNKSALQQEIPEKVLNFQKMTINVTFDNGEIKQFSLPGTHNICPLLFKMISRTEKS
ncbi:hypothetical protein C0584_04855 [Candidatus Parcubacteria bacterium]|nr:MAG: hypothetical protein C0584_04855 [Candidatus Parcubacteria bacterium]